jgi:hypothetical protein
MIIYFIMILFEAFFYFYIVSKLFSNFSKFRFVSFIAITNCRLFGFTIAAYVTMLNILVMYNVYIPTIVTIMSARMNDNRFVIKFNEILSMCKFHDVRSFVNFSGDIFGDILLKFLETIISKTTKRIIEPIPDNLSEETSKIDDFLIEDDEQFEKLNKELDNLLYLGSSIISQTLAGHKEEQLKNVGIFMSGINVLIGKKDKTKTN